MQSISFKSLPESKLREYLTGLETAAFVAHIGQPVQAFPPVQLQNGRGKRMETFYPCALDGTLVDVPASFVTLL